MNDRFGKIIDIFQTATGLYLTVEIQTADGTTVSVIPVSDPEPAQYEVGDMIEL